MINISQLQTAFIEIIYSLTGVLTIWSNQNAPTPSNDVILAKINRITALGSTDYESEPQDNMGTIKTGGDREVLLSLRCVSKSAMQILINLIDSLRSPINLKILTDNRVAYVNAESPPIDITIPIGDSFETQAATELLFRISKNYGHIGDIVQPLVTEINISTNIGDMTNNIIINQ